MRSRMASFELAFRMQKSLPEVLDFSKETEETKKLYGIDNPKSAEYGKRCLLATRLVERGAERGSDGGVVLAAGDAGEVRAARAIYERWAAPAQGAPIRASAARRCMRPRRGRMCLPM